VATSSSKNRSSRLGPSECRLLQQNRHEAAVSAVSKYVRLAANTHARHMRLLKTADAGATGQGAKLPQSVQLAQPRPQYGVRSASPGPQQRNRVQTKSGALRAIPVLLALIFITTAAMEKRTMSVRMAVANERAIFVFVNIALSPWFGSRCTDCTSVPH
jgi:hypothetical protein